MTTNFIFDVQKALDVLQERTIGLFRIHGTTQLVLVVEVDRDLLKVVSINQLGGTNTIHLPSDKGILYLFDEGVTLASIKYDNPLELKRICDELKIS